MKVVFKGVVEKKKKGCNCRGAKTRNQFVYTKEYMLPSGIRKKFTLGVPVEVNNEDGEFLLSYTYTTREGVTNVFEEV